MQNGFILDGLSRIYKDQPSSYTKYAMKSWERLTIIRPARLPNYNFNGPSEIMQMTLISFFTIVSIALGALAIIGCTSVGVTG